MANHIAPVATSEGSTLGTLISWSTSGICEPQMLEEALALGEIDDFPVPAVMGPATQFKAIMRGFMHARYQGTMGTHERALIQHPITRGRGGDVVVYTVNLAVKAGRKTNDLVQVGSIEFDTNLGQFDITRCEDARILPEDVDQFNRLVDKVVRAYRSVEGKLTYSEINTALTEYIHGSVGSVKIIRSAQNWFVPNIPALAGRNPFQKVTNLLDVIDKTVEGLELFRFDVQSTGCHMQMMFKAASTKITTELEEIGKEVDELGGGTRRLQNRKRKRLLQACANVGHYLTIYEVLLPRDFIEDAKREITASRTLIGMAR